MIVAYGQKGKTVKSVKPMVAGFTLFTTEHDSRGHKRTWHEILRRSKKSNTTFAGK